MKKHAYLILVHNNFSLAQLLLEMLDDERNDIYVHLDTKAEQFKPELKFSNIYFTQRTDVAWGSISQIKAELLLFEMASGTQDYDYYHLMSGACLPLKSQDEIHDFFDKNKGNEFISYDTQDWDKGRVRYKRLFVRNYRKTKNIFSEILRCTNIIFVALQKWVGYNSDKGYAQPLKKGANWVSLTHLCVRYLLTEMQATGIKRFSRAYCADEIYKQTLIFSSEFYKNVQNDSLRLIEWERGKPHVYISDDFERLKNSDKLFARKFDDNVDNEIINTIYRNIIE